MTQGDGTSPLAVVVVGMRAACVAWRVWGAAAQGGALGVAWAVVLQEGSTRGGRGKGDTEGAALLAGARRGDVWPGGGKVMGLHVRKQVRVHMFAHVCVRVCAFTCVYTSLWGCRHIPEALCTSCLASKYKQSVAQCDCGGAQARAFWDSCTFQQMRRDARKLVHTNQAQLGTKKQVVHHCQSPR